MKTHWLFLLSLLNFNATSLIVSFMGSLVEGDATVIISRSGVILAILRTVCYFTRLSILTVEICMKSTIAIIIFLKRVFSVYQSRESREHATEKS
jgi:hypothetical protein